MNCDLLREQFSAYLDGELDPKLASQVKAHVDSCDACRRELESLRELTGMLHELPREAAPETMERDVVSSIERETLLAGATRPRASLGRRIFIGAGLSAAAALVIVGVYMKFHAARPDNTTVAMTEGHASGSSGGASHGGYAYTDSNRLGVEGSESNGKATDYWGDASKEGTRPAAPENGYLGGIASAPSASDRAGHDLPGATAAAPTDGTGRGSGVVAISGGALKLAGGTVINGKASGPEVFEMRLASADPAATRARIVAAADALQIRKLNVGAVRGVTVDGTLTSEITNGELRQMEAEEKPGDKQPETLKADLKDADSITDPNRGGRQRGEADVRNELDRAAKTAQSDEEYEKVVTRLLLSLGDKDLSYNQDGKDRSDTTVIVLAVPEDKLQELVAKLAPEKKLEDLPEATKAPATTPAPAAPAPKPAPAPAAVATPAEPTGGEGKDQLEKKAAEDEQKKAKEEAKQANDDIVKALMDELDKYDAEDAERAKMLKESPPPETSLDKIKGTKADDARKPEKSAKDSTTAETSGGKKDAAKPAAPTATSTTLATTEKAAPRKTHLVYINIYLTRTAPPAAAAAPAKADETAPPAPAPAGK